MPLRIKIYVAGPYSNGDVAVNVRNAFEAGGRLWDLGFAPYVPHGTHFWHMMFPRPYEEWLAIDNEFVPICDAMLRLPGKSNGADKEVELAKGLGKPIFFAIEEVVAHFKSKT